MAKHYVTAYRVWVGFVAIYILTAVVGVATGDHALADKYTLAGVSLLIGWVLGQAAKP